MSTVSPDTSRESATPLTEWVAATTIEWSGFLYATNSLSFSSARRQIRSYTPTLRCTYYYYYFYALGSKIIIIINIKRLR